MKQIAQNLTLLLDLDEHVGQPAYVGGVGREQVERDPLGALGTHAGQPAELVDQVLDDAFVHGRLRTRAGRRRPAAPPGAAQAAAGQRAELGASASAWALASR